MVIFCRSDFIQKPQLLPDDRCRNVNLQESKPIATHTHTQTRTRTANTMHSRAATSETKGTRFAIRTRSRETHEQYQKSQKRRGGNIFRFPDYLYHFLSTQYEPT